MIQKRTQLSVLAVAALAVIAAALLAVVFTAGPTQAQSEEYADPKPCGPGFDEFYDLPEFPVDQVAEGHYAVFDAYYDLDSDEPHRPTEEGEAWAGLMSLNFCPPELEPGLGEAPHSQGCKHRHRQNHLPRGPGTAQSDRRGCGNLRLLQGGRRRRRRHP